jgi:hypothetical protein
MRRAFLLFLVVAAASAADTSPDGLRQLIREALPNLEKTDRSMQGYEFLIARENTEFDSKGPLKKHTQVVRHGYIEGFGVNHLISRDGVAVTPAEYQKHEDDIQKSIAARKAQQANQAKNKPPARGNNDADTWFHEAPLALDFRVAGEEVLGGRKTLVIAFSPHAGYRPINVWARVLEKMSGKIWIDPEESEIAKAEAGLFGDVTIGWGIVGRINQGSHFYIERIRLAPHVWVTQKETNAYSARLLFKTLRGEETASYSEFASRK